MAIRRPSPTFDVEALTYSLAEAAPRFPCGVRWLTDQIRSGRFSAHKIGGHWRMTQQDIEYALEQCRNGSHPSAHDDLGLTPTSGRRRKRESMSS